MRQTSLRFCRWAIIIVAAAVAGFILGRRWTDSCEFSSNLDECDARSTDVDFLRESARQLEEAALLLKIPEGEGAGEGEGDASRALALLQRVMARLDPRRALSAADQALRAAASADACGEVYKGSTFGRPFFREGFVPADECRRADKPPLHELLTALLLAPAAPPAAPPDAPLTALRAQHPRLRAVAAVARGRAQPAQPAHPLTASVAAAEREWAAPGALLNRLVALVRTPYVLVARDAVRVDELARLERLVYVVSVLGANASASNASTASLAARCLAR
ncbi:hypothetical protein R5R35_007431 [Gryllus longicercus]|uniref:Uncharacterized protein n=1 Tax=Gryllus longicercus TaxID=2509291 RepID=A0AAN9YUP5_9ORTH